MFRFARVLDKENALREEKTEKKTGRKQFIKEKNIKKITFEWFGTMFPVCLVANNSS